jgi:DNA/RNA non-specific endonuclease
MTPGPASKRRTLTVTITLLNILSWLVLVNLGHAWEAVLFEDIDYKARQLTIDGKPQDCIDLTRLALVDPHGRLPPTEAQNVSSIRPDGCCLRLYADNGCQQMLDRVNKDGSSRLFQDHGGPFNDRIKSISSCELDMCKHQEGSRRDTPTFWPQPPTANQRTKRMATRTEHVVRSGETVIVSSQPRLRNVHVPLTVQSVLYSTLEQLPLGPDFGSKDSHRFNELDGQPGDTKGHLFARSLGGSSDSWNLIPQSAKLNLGNGLRPNWKSTEDKIRGWLEWPCRVIVWHLELVYGNDSNRPHHFELDTQFWTIAQDEKKLTHHERLACKNDLEGNCRLETFYGQPH